MRSLVITLALTLAAAVLGALALWQLRLGGFEAVLGMPPTPPGKPLYTGFSPDQVHHIQISTQGASATFIKQPSGWQASAPWADRMDPRAAAAIIHFTLGMRAEDLTPAEKTDPLRTGLGDHAVRIRLEDANRQTLANFRLGRVTPWKAEVENQEQPAPTVFVQPRDRHRKSHVYIASGDITPLFKDGLKLLRDHHPFFFNPVQLQRLRIRSQHGDMTLGRESPQGPWRIVKPLDLPTDPAAIKTLLEGLFELRATRLDERANVTLPPAENPVKTTQIALTHFGSDAETSLEIHPPESPEAREVIGIVNDRPSTIFFLPAKPEAGTVSLASLPLTVNDLRDPTLTHLHVPSLRGISIQPATGREIVITRNPPQPWMATVDGTTWKANEENLFSLLKAVTTGRATGFESDAATDFTPWGLDRPFLTLRFLGDDNQAFELRFGMNSQGDAFVNRLGTATVMRIDAALVSEIAVRPYEWRNSALQPVNRVYLRGIERTTPGQPPLELAYNFNLESWNARMNGQDLGGALDPAKANFMLTTLEELKATRWLAPDDAGALAALASPSLSLKFLEEKRDDAGNLTGMDTRVLWLAPASPGERPGFYYGRLSSEAHPFLLDSETYRKIATPLLE